MSNERKMEVGCKRVQAEPNLLDAVIIAPVPMQFETQALIIQGPGAEPFRLNYHSTFHLNQKSTEPKNTHYGSL